MFEIWFSTTTGGVPMTRRSKLETNRVDDGSGNKKATLNLFGRFIGKKAPPNALRNWVDAQDDLAKDIAKVGYDCDKPGVRRVTRDRIHDLVENVEDRINEIDTKRDQFISDVPYMKKQILDSYVNDDCYSEVNDALNRWNPNPARMAPVFGVSDLEHGTGLVSSDRVNEAIAKSELATKKSIVATLEDELEDIFTRCHNPERVRGQLTAIEGLLTKLSPIINEFSSSPDLVEKLNEGMKILQDVPLDAEDLKATQGQAVVKQGLDLFAPPEPATPEPTPATTEQLEKAEEIDSQWGLYDGNGGYAHTPDEPEQPEPEQPEDTTPTTTNTEVTLEW